MKKYAMYIVLFLVFLFFFLFLTNLTFLNRLIVEYFHERGFFKQEEQILRLKVYIDDLFYRDNGNSFPKKSNAVIALIRFYDEQKEYEKLIYLYEYYIGRGEFQKLVKSIFIQPDVDNAGVYSDLANTYFNSKQYHNAIKYYKKAIEMKSSLKYVKNGAILDLAEEYNGLVKVYLALGDLNQASINLNKSFEVITESSENILQTQFSTDLVASEYYLKLKDYDNAEKFATNLFLHIPSDTLPIKSYVNHQVFYLIIANLQMGKVKFAQQRYNEAAMFYKKGRFLTKEFYGKESPKYVCASFWHLNSRSKLKQDIENSRGLEDEILNISRKIMKLNNQDNKFDRVQNFCGEY